MMDSFRIRRLFSYLLLLCLPLGWGWGCTACGGQCEDKPFTEQVRSYFLGFKPGSYWIYRNTQNGDIDSVYFVSENIYQEGENLVDCRKEDAVVLFRGFAKSKQFGYYVTSWSSLMETRMADISFAGDYDSQNTNDIKIGFNGRIYSNVFTLVNCCITGRASCYTPNCSGKPFRFLKLDFASKIGLVRWEAEFHPQFGQVTYELIRYNIIR